jgi:hypothetical protein
LNVLLADRTVTVRAATSSPAAMAKGWCRAPGFTGTTRADDGADPSDSPSPQSAPPELRASPIPAGRDVRQVGAFAGRGRRGASVIGAGRRRPPAGHSDRRVGPRTPRGTMVPGGAGERSADSE